MTQLYKVTDVDGSSVNGGRGRWTVGRWRTVRGPLEPCRHGLHLTTVAQLPHWIGPIIWRAETDGELLEAEDKWVARKARIVSRVEAWDERTARMFACDCAEHVLPIWERAYPDDLRPREVIAVARRYAAGEATEQELAATWRVARDAAFKAAAAGASVAAWEIASAAATIALDDAAHAAAAAAWAAAYSAGQATEAAAAWEAVSWNPDAERAGEYETAIAAARAAERDWQARHLADMLGLPWDVEEAEP